MDNKENFLSILTDLVVKEVQKELGSLEKKATVGISARHVHLSKEALVILFGKDYKLTQFKDLSQPGQFAADEKVELIGPRGTIKNVRILGPLRDETQIEISLSDARKLGLNCPVRGSGDLANTPGISLKGPNGEIELSYGVIIAQRHLHISPGVARLYDLSDGETVKVLVDGIKGGVMNHVTVRSSEKYQLELHIDTDEANAFGLSQGDYVVIEKY